jgi:hypothetical protein
MGEQTIVLEDPGGEIRITDVDGQQQPDTLLEA